MAPAVPVVFELFSGSGRVTAYLRKLGLQAAHGIDHVVVPKAASSTLIADPTTEEGPQLASFWITNPPLSAEFAAPPCGPHSRAFACENPSRSWFWNTSFFPGIAHLCPARVTFDHCAFGGHRPKRTTIASSLDCFSSVSKSCTRLTHTCRGMCPQTVPLPRLMPRIPHPLLMKSPRPLHVTLCLATGGHLVPCLCPQPCLPRAVPWPMISLKPLSSQFACQNIVQSSLSEAQASPGKSSVCTHGATPLSVNRGTTPHAYGVLLPMPRNSRFEDAQVVELAWGTTPHAKDLPL